MLSSAPHAGATNAGDAVAEARRAVDEVAGRYFYALARARTLDEQTAENAQRLAHAEARAVRIRAVATARALEIYKGASTSFVIVLNGSDALDSARRAELIDRANARSNEAFEALRATSEDLRARRAALQARRQDQAEALRDLEADQARLEASLDEAKRAHQEAQAEAAARVGAERRSAAREAAPATAALSATAPAELTTPVGPTAPPTSESAEPTPTTETPTAPADSSDAPAADGSPAPGAHPHHDDPFLVCVRRRESSDNYAAVSPAGYYGAYQFLPATWDTAATHANRFDLVGVLPSRASEYDQDEMAWTLYQWQGSRPWGGHC